MPMIGMSFFGSEWFQSPTGSVRNIKRVDLANSIVDELEIRERTDIPMTNVRNTWQSDTLLLARFINTLEAGNLQNEGVKVQSFVIKRRKIGELNDIVLGYEPFENNQTFVYTDITQPNDKFIYTISPLGENGIEGQPNSIEVESDFVGWWVVDKDTGEVMPFDKAIGDIGTVDTQLNQDRVEIKTFSKYPNVWYAPTEYHTFTLSTVVIPSEFERSGKNYEDILNKFIRAHKPFIIKSGDGRIFVCDVYTPTNSQPKNVWKGYDYFEIQIQATEIMDYNEFMSE